MDKTHKFMPVIIIIAIVIFGISIIDAKRDRAHLENMIAHLDEEVDEAKTGVERLLKKGISSENNLPKSNAKVELTDTEYDFGKIKKANGVVSTQFNIKNIGTEDLVIGDIITSCACTSTEVNKSNVAPNSSTTLTVSFDPNVHEEARGRLTRMIYVSTNDSDNPELEFTIFVEIE